MRVLADVPLPRFAVVALLSTALLAFCGSQLLRSAPPPARGADLGRRLLRADESQALPSGAALADAVEGAPEATADHVGYFLRSVELAAPKSVPLSLGPRDWAALEGRSHYRLLPGIFPDGMGYHFDGLATVLQFNFSGNQAVYAARAYESAAEQHYKTCLFVGTGTGPTLGYQSCLTNPGVNLLPIQGQLWLTIDTSKWGRVDPGSLETLPDSVDVPSTVLNAHPACDPATGECFVQYTCGAAMVPLTDQSCFGVLRPEEGNMKTVEVSRATLPKKKLIQHSHSPCITEHYVVSKLDAFTARSPLNSNSGLLKFVHQVEDDLWMVMDRRTNVSRVMTSTSSFVNNHFWNCFQEGPDGDVVVDAVAATEDYLDNYFERNLNAAAADWTKLFHPALRCRIPATGNQISCEPLFKGADQPFFDYPTYNPLFKMNPDYRYFYGIAPNASASRWFDRLIKVDAKERSVVASWTAPGVYFAEADFVPRRPGGAAPAAAEDDGLLVSLLYNSTSDASLLAVFDASNLKLLDLQRLAFVVPFHAHGIICENGGRQCFTNP